GKPIKYIAVPPKEVLERVKKNIKQESDNHVKLLDNLKDSEVIDELSSLHSSGVELVEPSDMSGSLKGRHNLYNHIDMTLRSAEKSISIMSTSEGFLRKVEGFKPLFEELKQRGVDIKIATRMNPETEKAAKELDGLAEVRHAELDARFIVVDGSEIIFMLMNDKEIHPTYDIGIWINTPFFAQAVQSLFEVAWNAMKEVKLKK
ncbi:MAG: TrmB family transcriptional regulator, partial [Candidatus Woesearchaeota archaeon]